MPSDAPAAGRQGPDKLSLIVFSGDFERVHYALAMASAAAAMNTPVTLFFTSEGIRALKGPGPGGAPGWHALPVDAAGKDARSVDAEFGIKGVATFEEMLSASVSFGVTFMVCEMGLRAVGLELADLRDDVTYVQGGIVSYLADASQNGATLFV
ncbi:MAG: DsrE family protein [Alphaproteobacteria bacterium]